MDDNYVCDYCTAAFGDISGLEEHIADHLTINGEDFQVFQDLIQYQESSVKEEKGKSPLIYENISSEVPCRSVESQEHESSFTLHRGNSLIKPTESENYQRPSIPCCICGHVLTKHPNIHMKLTSRQVLMEYQCEGCSLFFETEKSLDSHCQEGGCMDVNIFLQKEVNFRVLNSRNKRQWFPQDRESRMQACEDGNPLYKCGKCDYLSLDFNDWISHEDTHMNLQPFSCVICHENLSNYSSYLNHIEMHRYMYPNAFIQNQLDFSFECNKCDKSFGNAWDLLMHEESTHIDLYPFRCFACPKKCPTISSLWYHKGRCYIALFKRQLRQNLGDGGVSTCETIFNQALVKSQAIFCEGISKEKDIVCPFCKKREGSYPELTHHFAAHFGFLQCVYCNRPFKKIINLENQLPCDSKQFACQQCQQRPKDTDILSYVVCKKRKRKRTPYDPVKSRLNYQKQRQNRLLCDTCGVSIIGRQQFFKHMKTHDKPSCTDIDVQCPKCNALFETSYQLTIHLQRHHNTSAKVQCKFCPNMLSSKSSLRKHVAKCHSEKEAKFECIECKMKFESKRELNKHRNIHLSESKPYKCDQCEAAFAQNCNLTKHKIIHTGERPYKCDKCDAAFAHRSNLNKHSRIHTGKYSFRCDICNRGFNGMKEVTRHKESHFRLS